VGFRSACGAPRGKTFFLVQNLRRAYIKYPGMSGGPLRCGMSGLSPNSTATSHARGYLWRDSELRPLIVRLSGPRALREHHTTHDTANTNEQEHNI
jgi:hypothetical protein